MLQVSVSVRSFFEPSEKMAIAVKGCEVPAAIAGTAGVSSMDLRRLLELPPEHELRSAPIRRPAARCVLLGVVVILNHGGGARGCRDRVWPILEQLTGFIGRHRPFLEGRALHTLAGPDMRRAVRFTPAQGRPPRPLRGRA